MSESDRTQEEFSTAAELQSFVNNDLDNENDKVRDHMGLVPSGDSHSMELMNLFEHCFDPSMHPEMPHFFKNTDVGSMLRKNLATKVGTQAVREGNISQMKYITGKQNYGNDATALHTVMQLRNKMGQDAYIGYLFGHMGNGKSDFAFLLGEIAKKELGYKVYSNVRSPYEKDYTDGYIYTFGELLKTFAGGEKIEELKQIEENNIDVSDQNILFIFDEGNQQASGYSSDAYDAMEKLGKMLTLIRKVGGILIIIGHTGKDVHPHIRRLSNDCIHKVSKKQAKFYNDVKEAEGVGLKDEIVGIPKTNWYFDTLEISFWDWTLSTQDDIDEMQKRSLANNSKERNMSIFQDYHTGDENHTSAEMTQEVLADKYDLTTGRISQILSEMEEKVKSYQEAQ